MPEKVGDGETILEDGDRIAIADATVRALRGRLSALRVSHSISVLYGAFVWACRVLNNQKWYFPARAGGALPRPALGAGLPRRRRRHAHPRGLAHCRRPGAV